MADVECPEFLDAITNPRCVEELIKELPFEFREQLAQVIDIINRILNFEQEILKFFNQYYLILLNLINQQIELLKQQFSDIIELYNQVKGYWNRFKSCPGASLLAQIIEEKINDITGDLNERVFQRDRTLGFLQRVGIRNADLLVKRILLGDSTVIGGLSDYLNAWGNCLRKGIPGINPPYTGGAVGSGGAI